MPTVNYPCHPGPDEESECPTRPEQPENYLISELENGPYIENWQVYDQFNDQILGPFCCLEEAQATVFALANLVPVI